jgi:hypothetical protein
MSDSNDAPVSPNALLAGYWEGSYYSNKLPFPVPVQLTFLQMSIEQFMRGPYGQHAAMEHFPPGSDAIVGTFMSHTGAMGWSSGPISGNHFSLVGNNVPPACPGNYTMEGEVNGTDVTWQFDGQDCLGHEIGRGEASRKFEFPKTDIHVHHTEG